MAQESVIDTSRLGRKRAARSVPKGRQVDARVLAEVQALLADSPRRRDLLIEFLHRIQDAHGCIAAAHIVALAQELRLAMTEVYEVATFYHHFDVVTDGQATPPPITVRVCETLSCQMAGADALRAELAPLEGRKLRVIGAPCIGRCEHAPAAVVGRNPIDRASTPKIIAAVEAGRVEAEPPAYIDFAAYRRSGGYRTLHACVAGERTVDAVLAELENSALRGLGGAGFPAGRKWRIVRAEAAPRLMAVNIDEGEPGTFKDRYYLERDPHRFLEGSKRGMPRLRPPYVAQVGLFGRPTLEQNMETLYWVRDILEKGADWFANQGRHGRKGPRSFSVSGRVAKPGVHLAPAGITVRELIAEYCGGMLPGHEFYAYLPGGASGGILPASLGDIPLDFDTLQPYGCFIGSAAVIVLSQHDRARDAALNLMRFFADESCGQCTPCRVGTEKAVGLMARERWDEALLKDLSQAMADASICGLGQAAPNPIACVFKYFPQELED